MNAQATNQTAREVGPGRYISLVGVVVVVALGVLFFVNPSEHRVFPPCVFHLLTGWHCPGCGATRAAHELLHGNLAAAFHDNALFVLSLPVLAALALRQMSSRRQVSQNPPRIWAGWLWVGLAVMLAFGVWRNLPSGAWLAP